MILNSSHFNSGSLNIPNAQGATSTFGATNNGIQDFIDKCEELVLSDALKPSLFQTIKTAYNGGTDLPNNADQWIKDLVNGLKYTYNDKEYTFKGVGGSYGCLAFFIYNKYLTSNYGTLGIDGMERLNNTASNSIDPTPKDVDTWNTFVTLYQGDNYANNLPIIHHGAYGTMIDYYGKDRQSSIVDLLTFLEHYEELNTGTYENLNKRFYERKNSFGL